MSCSEEYTVPSILGDLIAGILPGIVIAIAYLKRPIRIGKTDEESKQIYKEDKMHNLALSSIPILVSLLWFTIRRLQGHSSKVSSINVIIIGNLFSFAIVLYVANFIQKQ